MDGDPRSSPTYRAAKLAVIILTALFALGVVALAVGFVRQYRIFAAARAAAHTAGEAVAPGAPGATLTLARGAHIVSATADSGKLVLRLATEGGEEVDVIDLVTGKLTAEVKAPR